MSELTGKHFSQKGIGGSNHLFVITAVEEWESPSGEKSIHRVATRRVWIDVKGYKHYGAERWVLYSRVKGHIAAYDQIHGIKDK